MFSNKLVDPKLGSADHWGSQIIFRGPQNEFDKSLGKPTTKISYTGL